ncbi:hypothetical protein CCACVL1_05300 [Corchorus capsularis]|uniref:Reverse transcriptase zinc-binding domain-containing protein n=1 Tax=Corchorus capsularis TaxID=210143 RepID=A0A1R3JLM5_COCAP|nr:hypothetical protein CCACVL1_05300 [Corchorus capsularis]
MMHQLRVRNQLCPFRKVKRLFRIGDLLVQMAEFDLLVIPTGPRLSHRGLEGHTHCVLCNQAVESIQHLFKECSFAVNIWSRVGLGSSNLDFELWFKNLVSDKSFFQVHRVPRGLIATHIIWEIWKTRNRAIFQGTQPDLNSTISIAMSKAVEFFAINGKMKPLPLGSVIPVSWQPPGAAWLKLNTGGSSLGNPGLAGAGAVIRDHEGGWVRGLLLLSIPMPKVKRKVEAHEKRIRKELEKQDVLSLVIVSLDGGRGLAESLKKEKNLKLLEFLVCGLNGIKRKKLKDLLAVREELYGKSAKVVALTKWGWVFGGIKCREDMEDQAQSIRFISNGMVIDTIDVL